MNNNNSGFSMVEMIIVVVIMAIFAGMSAPFFIDAMNRSREQQEANTMEQIQEAMKVFAEEHDKLPDVSSTNNAFCNTTNNTWNECLATASNLSAYQIITDTWGNPRTYTHFSRTEKLLGSDVEMHYGVVVSMGRKEVAQAKDQLGVTLPYIATEIDSSTNRRIFSANDTGNWWSLIGTDDDKVKAFQLLAVGEGNYVTKFTNKKIKLQQYEVTLEHMNKISNALETYSRAKYNEAIILGETNADKKVFYPLSRNPGGDSSANYGNKVITDSTTYAFSASNRVENRDATTLNKTNRKDDMVKLMRLIGLPDSYCCNEMEKEPDNNNEQKALFYYSNPRAWISGTSCSTRAGVGDPAPLYLPARISVEPFVCE